MDTKEKMIKADSKLDLRTFASLSRQYWWVYVASLVCFLGMALLYLYIKTPQYEIAGSMIINDYEDDSSGSLPGDLGALMSTFSMGSQSSKLVDDEMKKVGSMQNLMRVVKRLDLNKVYCTTHGLLAPKTWHYGDSPLVVDIPDAVLDTLSKGTRFDIKVSDDGRDIKVKVRQGKWKETKRFTSFPATVRTPMATFVIRQTPAYVKGESLSFRATVSSPLATARTLAEDIDIDTPSKKSSIIEIVYEDGIVQRGKDIVNTMIESYNEMSLADTKSEAASSVAFIEDRLINLYQQLESSETQIEDYKRANQIVDAEAEAEYIFKKKEIVETGLLELQTKAEVLKMVIDFLNNDQNSYSMLPFTEDVPEEPIADYNKLVMERIKLESQAKKDHAALRYSTQQIEALRRNMLISLEKQLQSTKIAIADMSKVAAGSRNRMEGIPRMEKELTALYRDQKIQNQIYAFMLQKHEENQLKLARDLPRGKVIDLAFESEKPVKPKKFLIAGAAGALGLIFPAYGFYLWSGRLRRRYHDEQLLAEAGETLL